MTDYSAGYEFPRDLHDDAPRLATVDDSPGSEHMVRLGCCCISGKGHPITGHLLAERCPVHLVTFETRAPSSDGCPDCGCDPEACGCAGNDREGRV